MAEGYARIGKQCKEITDRIGRLPNSARVAIVVSAAQRLMDEHVTAPAERRDPFVLEWAPYLALIWQMLLSPTPAADRSLRDRLDEYYSGPYCHELGDEALPGADQDAAAAAIYAVEAYCRRSAKSATSGSLRLLAAADLKAEHLIKNRMSAEAEEKRAQVEQEELDRIELGLSLLEREGVTQASVEELRRIFGQTATT